MRFTYAYYRRYPVDILEKILKQEKEALVKYQENKEFDHERACKESIRKIEIVIKEKENR